MAEGTVAADELRLLIERIERLEERGAREERRQGRRLQGSQVRGYCAKTMRKVVRLRRLETHTRQEEDALLETYRQALGLAKPAALRTRARRRRRARGNSAARKRRPGARNLGRL
jgi:uncharacterized protein (UPF0335 family)